MSIIDFAAERFRKAGSAADVSVRETLVEAIRRIDVGEFKFESIILIGLDVSPENGGTRIDLMHGGPANTNERLGMYARATDLSLRAMNGDA